MTAETVVSFDLSTLVILVFAVINLLVLGPISWILGNAIRDMRELGDELEELKDEVHVHYLRKEEYRENIKEIKEMLAKIFDKLEAKADK